MRPQQQAAKALCFAVACPAVRLSSVRPLSLLCWSVACLASGDIAVLYERILIKLGRDIRNMGRYC